MYGWFGILAPAGTPPPIAQKLRDEVAKAVADAGVDQDARPSRAWSRSPRSPPNGRKYLQSELAVYTKITKDANIKP